MIGKNWFILTGLFLAFSTLSATANFTHVDGNGKIVKEERKVSGFKSISVKNAIHLLITQGDEEKVVVETDENILPHLYTEVSEGELKIGIKGSVSHTKMLNVYVTVKQLNGLETSSAAKATSENKLKTGDLKISSSSGSAVKIEIDCSSLNIDMSSGSAVVIKGTAKAITADCSSGSALATSDLKVEKGDLDGSSGAAMVVQITKEVKAQASSGAQITVSGNPAIRDTDSSSGGSVRIK